ncbi:hypothetical protein AGMMS50218_12930 [Actinomycetota bacterium]|nr:hypothetical protein AGMMS50218_12930 [Actinomycetota bacterium]
MLISQVWVDLAEQHGVSLTNQADAGPGTVVRLTGPRWPTTAYRTKVFPFPVRPSRLPDLDRTRTDGLPLLLLVPATSAALLAAAHERGISVLVAPTEEQGGTRGLLIARDGTTLEIGADPAPAPAVRASSGRTPWATYAVAHTLLAASAPYTQTALADALGVSQPRVSQILSRLAPHVRRGAAGWEAIDRRALADWLAVHYPRPRLTATWLTLDPVTTAAERLGDSTAGAKVALTGQVAADQLAPWARPTLLTVLVDRPLDLSGAGLVPAAPSVANVLVQVSDDPYALTGTRPGRGALPVAAPWRVQVELAQHGDVEAADVLAEALLSGRLT